MPALARTLAHAAENEAFDPLKPERLDPTQNDHTSNA
jgi:hypothetical protein